MFSVFYFSDIMLRASGKHFWFDEIYTVNLCRIPAFHDLQQAVLHGADYNPDSFICSPDGPAAHLTSV